MPFYHSGIILNGDFGIFKNGDNTEDYLVNNEHKIYFDSKSWDYFNKAIIFKV